MIRVIVFASLSVQALADAQPTCMCLGKEGLGTDRGVPFECTFDFAKSGKCLDAPGLKAMGQNFTTVAEDYGESCKAHEEPGWGDCYNQTTSPPSIRPPAEQADWCNKAWCYVDPCNCDASPAPTKSDYFPETVSTVLVYSYETCGDKNLYTADKSEQQAGNSQDIDCAAETVDASVTGTTSNAPSLKVGLGLVPASLLAAMCF